MAALGARSGFDGIAGLDVMAELVSLAGLGAVTGLDVVAGLAVFIVNYLVTADFGSSRTLSLA